MAQMSRPHCKYIVAFVILCIAVVFLFQSVAIIIGFEETQNYINNTCKDVGNLTVQHWNNLNNRATTMTKSLDSVQNITLYYPPVDVWIFWDNNGAHKWYDQLKTFNKSNMTFPCYVDYPQDIGISHHLDNIWVYYAIATAMFIVCSGCIIYCSMKQSYIRAREYYPLN